MSRKLRDFLFLCQFSALRYIFDAYSPVKMLLTKLTEKENNKMRNKKTINVADIVKMANTYLEKINGGTEKEINDRMAGIELLLVDILDATNNYNGFNCEVDERGIERRSYYLSRTLRNDRQPESVYWNNSVN